MKIPAMKKLRSNETETAYRTDPPMTQELLDCALRSYLGPNYSDLLAVENGLLIVRQVGIPAQNLEMLAERLTDAENFLANQKRNAQSRRDDDLKARAQMSGVPLED